MAVHSPEDIVGKGTMGNYTTRPGEGFLVEVKESYMSTNRRRAEQQVCFLFYTAITLLISLSLIDLKG
jgi:hypothetical protein